jgi:hypothetical protein
MKLDKSVITALEIRDDLLYGSIFNKNRLAVRHEINFLRFLSLNKLRLAFQLCFSEDEELLEAGVIQEPLSEITALYLKDILIPSSVPN